jgi:hypothetical protein
MAAKIRLKFDSKEIRLILTNPAVQEELHRRAVLILDAIDHEGYEVISSTGRDLGKRRDSRGRFLKSSANRARASVVARSPYARRSNAIHNTLVRNIGAGRG